MKEDHCKTCGKKVAFLKDENGKTQILDLVAPVYEVYEGPTRYAIRRYDCHVSHFSTCPQATAHSKRRKKP